MQIVVAICFGWKAWGYGGGVDSSCVCIGSRRIVGKSGNADLRSVRGSYAGPLAFALSDSNHMFDAWEGLCFAKVCSIKRHELM